MTAAAPTFSAPAASTDLSGVSTGLTGLAGSATSESSGDVFAQIFARLVGTNSVDQSLPSIANLVLPSLTSPAVLAGGQPIPTTLPGTAVPTGTNKTSINSSLKSDQIPTFESIQAFSTALAAFLATAPAEGGASLPAGEIPSATEATNESADRLLQLTDLLTPIFPDPVVVDSSFIPGNVAIETKPNIRTLPSASADIDPRLIPTSAGIEAQSAPLKGRLQPFQPGLQGPTRRVGDDLSAKVDAGNTNLNGSLTGSVSLESLLGANRSSRIVVDKAILKQVDKLLGRSPTVDQVAERGVSILTPEELKPTAASVEDRNATALARVDRSEFVNRVVQALERAHAERPKRIEVEIQPPALGKLKVQVIERNGELTARIEVHSSTTRSLLIDNLPTLDRNLGEHGVQIQRFQVDQTNTGYSNLGEQPRDAPQQNMTGQEPRQDHRQPDFFEPADDESERGPPISLAELLGLADGMDRVI
jgi:hypothetical protein